MRLNSKVTRVKINGRPTTNRQKTGLSNIYQRKGFSERASQFVFFQLSVYFVEFRYRVGTQHVYYSFISRKNDSPFLGRALSAARGYMPVFLSLNAAMALSCYVFINVLSSGGSREGARGSHRSPLILTKKEEITEGKHPPAQSLDPPLLSTCLCNITEGVAINLPCQMKI